MDIFKIFTVVSLVEEELVVKWLIKRKISLYICFVLKGRNIKKLLVNVELWYDQ